MGFVTFILIKELALFKFSISLKNQTIESVHDFYNHGKKLGVNGVNGFLSFLSAQGIALSISDVHKLIRDGAIVSDHLGESTNFSLSISECSDIEDATHLLSVGHD